VHKLERQDDEEDPGDLRDGDGTSDRKWCVADLVGRDEDIIQSAEVVKD
jgi:hypothetical protein